MRPSPFVSIVIVNYNGRAFLRDCLISVLSTEYPCLEIILVDNASTDKSIESVRSILSDPRIRLVRNSRNLGVAEGHNVGIKSCRGEYIIFLNSDTRVNNYWVRELVNLMESDSRIGIAQGNIMTLNNPAIFDCAGGFIDRFGWPYKRGEGQPNHGQYNGVTDIFYAHGAAMMCRRETLAKTGLLDPDFFMLYEETDLCWRTWLAGYRVVFAPISAVYHIGGGSSKETDSDFIRYLYHRNHIQTMLKNYDCINALKYSLPTVMLVLIMMLYFAIIGQNKRAIAYMKAALWNLVNLNCVWQKRLRIQRCLRKTSDGELFRKKIFLPGCVISKFLNGHTNG